MIYLLKVMCNLLYLNDILQLQYRYIYATDIDLYLEMIDKCYLIYLNFILC